MKIRPHVKLKSVILIVVCGLLVLADLLTKYFEEKYAWNYTIISGVVQIRSGVRNPGCAFSFLNENPEIGQPILITFTSVMLAVLIAFFIFLPERFTLLKTSIAIVSAGAIGNLVDRIMLREVRDFFGLWMGGMTYCNFADFCVVVGAIIAIIDILFLDEIAIFPLTKKAKAARANLNRDGDVGVETDGEGLVMDETAGEIEGTVSEDAENCDGHPKDEESEQLEEERRLLESRLDELDAATDAAESEDEFEQDLEDGRKEDGREDSDGG